MAKHLMRPSKRATYPSGADQYAPAILAAWRAEFPDSVAEDRDKEDWVENAIFLEALKRLGLDHEIMGEAENHLISATRDFVIEGSGEPAFFHVGIRGSDHTTGIDYSLPLQKSDRMQLVTNYALSKTFRDAAGRGLSYATPDGRSVDEAVRSILPGAGTIFIKTIKKETARSFNIEAGRSPWQQMCEQDENLPWSIMQFDGMETPYFLVQTAIAPTFEYRMFMVGANPVTGAGCIEACTPLENEKLYDPKMERIRNVSEVSYEQDLVSRYFNFACQFGLDFASEIKCDTAYSLDLCIDDNTGEVVAIELNPAINLGRYASDVDAWILAVDNLMKKQP